MVILATVIKNKDSDELLKSRYFRGATCCNKEMYESERHHEQRFSPYFLYLLNSIKRVAGHLFLFNIRLH